MELSGTQFKQLHEALQRAFPNLRTLQEFVVTELDERLDTIAGSSGFSDSVFQLITWALARGRLVELVEKAYRANSGNPELRAFAISFLGPATVKDVQQIARNEFPGADVTGIREENNRILGSIVWKGFRGQNSQERNRLITEKVRDRLGLRGLHVGFLFPIAPGEKE